VGKKKKKSIRNTRQYYDRSKNTTDKKSSIKGEIFLTVTLTSTVTKLIPAKRINISTRREQHRGKQRRISCLVSVKLQGAVRMVQNCKRRSRELRGSPLLDDYSIPEGMPTPTRLHRHSKFLIRGVRESECSHAPIRISQSDLRLDGYFGYVVNPDSDRPDANATHYARAKRRNQSTFVLIHDYLRRTKISKADTESSNRGASV